MAVIVSVLCVFQVEAMQAVPGRVTQLEKDVTKQTQRLAVIEGDWQRKFQKLSDNVTLQVDSVSKMQVESQRCLQWFLSPDWHHRQ